MKPRGEETGRESQFVLLLDDDVMITEGLAAGLEREGRTVVTCNDIESAELIVQRFQPSHIVADIRISGQFGFEGLDLIRYAKRHAPESRVILISGNAPEELQMEASQRGAVAFLQKPFSVEELDAMLDMISASALTRSADERGVIRIPLLHEILDSADLRPFFQPIVALDGTGRHMGYESLARYRTDTPLRNPVMLFQYAARKQRVPDLEFACMKTTMEAAPSLPPESLLFMNVHPDALGSGSRLTEALVSDEVQSGIGLDRVVLEITEQGSLTETPVLLRTIEELREHGVRFAFDDVGVAYSHLPLIGKIRPSFLKISQDFGSSFETDTTKTKIVMNLRSLAQDFNCDLILEGIEHFSTAQAAAELKIPYGQGFYFGRPADIHELRPAL
jgi:EAL domain-containing protein (putative c-di-GMP-specific phosphodiesterase class I)